ncbi:MAG: glycosyltransferase [Pirellulales bacterium]|nr:glycosyltransferase [Pirellulales bacterium]
MTLPVVCQVLHSLNVGGAEILAANLARKLRDRFDFVFACLDERGTLGEQLQREGFEVEVIGRRAGVHWTCMRRLSAYFRQRQVQLIHAHQYTPFFYSAASGLFGRRPALLFTEHGRWYPDCRSRKRVFFNRVMLRPRDRVVGVGEHVRRALIENEGLDASRVAVIYNGVSSRPAAHDAEENTLRAQVRAELGIAKSEFVVIQVARLDPLKDHLTAIEALAEIVETRRNIHLVLVGAGPEQPSILSAVGKRSLTSFVHLLGLRADVDRLLKAADCFLLTSISEGIPLTVIEAMMAGLPVVATSVGGVPEVVQHNLTGLLVAPRSPREVAAALLQLADDPNRCTALGATGRNRARDHFSDNRMNASYAKMYENMLGG